jgi:uracil-DNA glycosylase family 4
MKLKPAGGGSKFAEGPKNARVMLVGQNPGQEEVRQNRPFVGRSGKYLDRVLQEKGIARDLLYLTSVVKEPTPGNRKPTAGEIKRWMPHLMREIEEINPEIVVLLGRVAWKTPRMEGIEYMETYHPAAAMRFPRVKQRFEKDIETLRRKMEGTV